MSGFNTVTMGDRGRFVVPAELRQRLGWEVGTVLHLVESDVGVTVMTREQLRDHVRDQWRDRGTGVLDELFAERRASAQAELDASR